MISRHSWYLAPFLSLIVTACGTQAATPATAQATSATGGTYTNITPSALAEMLASKDFLLVNTHVPYEGEIEQTDAFIAYEEGGPQRVGEYPADRSARIVLYCRSGRMSAIVAEELVNAGYKNVWNLEGGMIAWERAGYAIIGQ